MTVTDDTKLDKILTFDEQTTPEEYRGGFNADDYKDAPPDGGLQAWICVGCVTVMNMMTWGVNGAFAIFLAFYLENDVFPGASPTDYALIGGIVAALALLLIPFSAILLQRFGYRLTISTGIVIGLGAYIGASYARTISELYITQGLLSGVSFGLIFGANSIVLPSWFLNKRALANGISHFGVGIGSAFFSLIVNALIRKTGDQKWALRVIGIVSTVLVTVSMLLVKIRVPRIKPEKKTSMQIIKGTFDYRVWKSWPLQLTTAWSCCCVFGYTICLFSLANYARSLGFTHTQSTNVSVTFSIAQGIGRPLIGYLSDKVGKVNFSMFGTTYCAIFTFIIWVHLSSFASVIVFAFFLGLLAGTGSVNVVPLVADVVGYKNFPSGLSWTNSFTGVACLIAEVIALKLRDYKLSNPYLHCQYFVGSVYIAATLILIPYRAWKVDRMLFQLKDSKQLSGTESERYQRLHEDRSPLGYLKRVTFMGTI